MGGDQRQARDVGGAGSHPRDVGRDGKPRSFRPLPIAEHPALEQAPFRRTRVVIADLQWRLLSDEPGWSEQDPYTGLFGHVARGGTLLAPIAVLADRDPAQFAPMLAAMRAIAAGDLAESTHLYVAPGEPEERHQLCLGSIQIAGVACVRLAWLPAGEVFALRRERQRLGTMLMRTQANLIRAQEQERQRLARDLHDNAAQYLVALSLSVARLQSINKDPAVTAVAAELSESLTAYHRAVRGMTYSLHPPELEQHGLHATVRELCDGLTRRSNLAVALQAYGLDRRRGTAVEHAIFRLLQEALSNVQVHAGACRVRVRLVGREGCLLAVVQDDGKGLPADWQERPQVGVGIPGMAHRIAELGGSFRIRARRGGRGTTVAAVIPRGGAQDFVYAAGNGRDGW